MRRVLYILLLLAGLGAAAYAGWCLCRVSGDVLIEDRSWPRAWPYPDRWLLSLDNWFDARYPAPPGTFKLNGEIERVRWTCFIGMWISLGIGLSGGLLLLLPWLRRLNRRRGFEVIDDPS